MTLDDVIKALTTVRFEFKQDKLEAERIGCPFPGESDTKGGYFLVGDVAVKIAKIKVLK